MANESYLRRSQAIAPFGVGAIHVLKGAQAVVTAGLDFWFKAPHDPCGCEANAAQLTCVRVNESRLEKQLQVSHFRLPPGPETEQHEAPGLSIPLFRFPSWFVCPRCGTIRQEELTAAGVHACHQSECNGEAMHQVRFAAACEAGHLQDFPWREWVHRERTPVCSGELTYQAGGSGTLDDITVRCSCKKARTLNGIMGGGLNAEGTQYTNLSSRLLQSPQSDRQPQAQAEIYSCSGGRVWLGERSGNPCDRPMKAALINATNVHYARVASALWIPTADAGEADETMRNNLDAVAVRNRIRIRRSLNDSDDVIADDLVEKFPELFAAKDRASVLAALSPKVESYDPGAVQTEDTDELKIRIPEYPQLQRSHTRERTGDHLELRPTDISGTSGWFRDRIDGIYQVDRLRETRVLYGFSRLMPQKPPGTPAYQSQMWKHMPVSTEDRWLPAAVVYGEGIFVRFNEARLSAWESAVDSSEYLRALQERSDAAALAAKRDAVLVSPRLVMLHTLAHLLIRRLSFECGYNASSLRERLYVNRNPENSAEDMAGVLIYTASGDCEGSLGGLVRMGEPARFQQILAGAVADARWCTSDPVCDEIGHNGGQGTDGLNLSACHCCALLPETSCEQFNRFLDRGLVAGRSAQPDLGFFSGI